MTNSSDVILHVFCDASSQAYGAVPYMVNDNSTSFLIAKSRVVPRHAEAWSIPCKELIAVLEGSRIAIISWKSFEGRIKKLVMWTDAMTVLSWLTNDSIHPNKYIRRKLDKLNTLYRHFEHVEFKHVPTTENPADVASRGLNLVRDGVNCINLWLNGSLFLIGKCLLINLNLSRLMSTW